MRFAELVAEKTGGKIKIEIFPASQLGSEKEQTEQVRSGALHFHSSGGSIQQFVPDLQLIGLPGLWKSHDHVFKVVTGDAGKQLIELVEKKNVGIKVLTLHHHRGPPLRGPQGAGDPDRRVLGLKIRVDTQPASAAIWRAVKANPVPIAFAEVYSSLQTGVIDAAENPPCGILSMKFYEQAKHITTTGHQLTLMAVMVNQKWHDGLAGGRAGSDPGSRGRVAALPLPDRQGSGGRLHERRCRRWAPRSTRSRTRTLSGPPSPPSRRSSRTSTRWPT